MPKQNRRLPRFIIRFSAGMGDEDYKIVSARDLDQAMTRAWEEACQTYEGYVGLHGVRTLEEIMQEDHVSENAAEMIFGDERESYLDYDAKCISKLRGS